ncbi:PilZ domain-containing protein [Sphingomonas flavalba]|uniref:PilZ domain-containing protein n=1 Tax=Sphingomonas flavalba TaxID=2559804 RepID=UPI0039E11B60
MLRSGHLTTDGVRAICYIHMVSAGGMMAETGLALAPHDRVSVELRPGHPIAGKVLWADGVLAGIRFDGWIDLLRMLGNESIDGFAAAAADRARTTLPMLRRPAPDHSPR